MTYIKIILLITFLSCNCFAADLCVTPSGSGNGLGGDWGNAIAWSSATLARGNTYYLADGTYASKTLSTAVSGATYINIVKATTSSHVTETGWSASMGDGQAEFTAPIYFTTSYWVFDGVIGSGTDGDSYGFKIGTPETTLQRRLYFDAPLGLSNVQVKHIYFHMPYNLNTSWQGIYTNPTGGRNSTLTVANNYFKNGVVGILIRNTDDSVFEYNIFDNNISSSSSWHGTAMSFYYNNHRLTIRYNTFKDICGTADIAYFGDDTKIYGNIFYHSGSQYSSAGMGVVTTSSGYNALNLLFYNNTIVNRQSGNSGVMLYEEGGVASTGTAYNNLWYACSSVGFRGTTHGYNVFINSPLSSGYSLNANESSSPSGGSPFENDFLNGDFSLSSPSVIEGTTLAADYTTDMFGITRDADGWWDVGAIEYNAGVSTTPPVSTTSAATEIGQTTCQFNGTVNPSGKATTYNFQYGTTQANLSSSTASTSAGSGSAEVTVYGTPATLTENTTYYFRLYAWNSDGEDYGDIMSFTTSQGAVTTPDYPQRLRLSRP
jgi:hypothetical protein